jgi:hypothetical protein
MVIYDPSHRFNNLTRIDPCRSNILLSKKNFLVDLFMFISIIQIIFRHVRSTTLNRINFCII